MPSDHADQKAFVFDSAAEPDEEHRVEAGEKRHFQYEVGKTYLGRTVEIPVTIVNGERPGSRLCLSAAVHGNEINGVKVIQRVADRYEPADLDGTLVCIHVANMPGYQVEERYLPVYDRDLNRSFPGSTDGSEAARMAKAIYDQFVGQCDRGLDFHTSTRNKLTLMHARADTNDDGVADLVDAFGATLVLSGAGAEGSLRREATEDGIPTATIEMGEENRFQPVLIERAVNGVENVMAAYDLLAENDPQPSTVTKELGNDEERKWLRADAAGLVEMEWGPHPVVDEGETVCTITDQFGQEEHTVEAPFEGLLIGILADPRVLPGRPVAHLVELSADERDAVESAFEEIGFQAQRTFHWMGTTSSDIVETALDSGEDGTEGDPER